MVSTSLVTRLTSEPRRSPLWVSTARSWTWRNARTRRLASPASVALNNRTLTIHAVPAVTSTTRAASAQSSDDAARRPGHRSARTPASIVCCTATGTASLPSVVAAAIARVTPMPSANSGVEFLRAGQDSGARRSAGHLPRPRRRARRGCPRVRRHQFPVARVAGLDLVRPVRGPRPGRVRGARPRRPGRSSRGGRPRRRPSCPLPVSARPSSTARSTAGSSALVASSSTSSRGRRTRARARARRWR